MTNVTGCENSPTVIAHLGAHKTATSLVQKYFRSKKDYYLAQDLLFITRAEISPYISWGDFVIKEPEKLEDYIGNRLHKSGASQVLFSNENALGRPFKKVPGLFAKSVCITG